MTVCCTRSATSGPMTRSTLARTRSAIDSPRSCGTGGTRFTDIRPRRHPMDATPPLDSRTGYSVLPPAVRRRMARTARAASIVHPPHVACSAPMIRESGEGKQDVGKPVQVDDRRCRHILLRSQLHDAALGATADRAGVV